MERPFTTPGLILEFFYVREELWTMKVVVQKYGGTSVGTTEKIKRVADKIIYKKREGYDVVVVVSAKIGRASCRERV